MTVMPTTYAWTMARRSWYTPTYSAPSSVHSEVKLRLYTIRFTFRQKGAFIRKCRIIVCYLSYIWKKSVDGSRVCSLSRVGVRVRVRV